MTKEKLMAFFRNVKVGSWGRYQLINELELEDNDGNRFWIEPTSETSIRANYCIDGIDGTIVIDILPGSNHMECHVWIRLYDFKFVARHTTKNMMTLIFK